MRVDHVSIAVRSIDEALGFFRSFLPIEMRNEARPGYTDDFNWCDFYVGNFKLELIEATRPDSFVQRFIDRRGEGLHHLSLEATDLEAKLHQLEADGVRIVDRWADGDGDLTAFVSPRSAHGVLIQFWSVPRIESPRRRKVTALPLRSGETIRMMVDHVSIAVRDLGVARQFFQRHFPLQDEHPAHLGYDGSFRLQTFTLHGYRIELIEAAPDHAQGFVARFLARRGEGFHHLSIDVDRLDPLLAQLEADGVRIVDRFDLGNGWQTAFISPRSAHGVLIQFWQAPGVLGES